MCLTGSFPAPSPTLPGSGGTRSESTPDNMFAVSGELYPALDCDGFNVLAPVPSQLFGAVDRTAQFMPIMPRCSHRTSRISF